MENWKDVIGFENEYEVSNLGNVRRKSKNIKASVSPHGYKTLSLCKNGITYTRIVHRLVAQAFIPNPENKEQVNHKDCNKTNNTLENLEWVTVGENIQHAVDNNRYREQNGEKNNNNKLSEQDVLKIRELFSSGKTTYSIHKEFFPQLHQQTIYKITQNKLWKKK